MDQEAKDESETAAPPPPPTAKERLDAARRACVAKLGALHVQRERLKATLEHVEAQIRAHHADVDAMDKVVQVL